MSRPLQLPVVSRQSRESISRDHSPVHDLTQFFAQQVYPNAYLRVLIRYRKTVNITSVMRLRYKSRSFSILWVGVPAEARKVIELLCEELQAKGTVA